MRHHGHEPVVVSRRQHEHVGAEAHDDALEPVEGLQVGRGRGRQRPDRAHEEVRIGAGQAGLLGPRHRMATDEARVVGLPHNGRLDAAHIRHDDVGPPAFVVQDPARHPAHRRGGHGDEDHLRLQVVDGGVDDARVERSLQAFGVRVEPRDVPPASAQPERDGAADQPRPDDECPPARSGLSRGGHRGALGRRGGRCA